MIIPKFSEIIDNSEKGYSKQTVGSARSKESRPSATCSSTPRELIENSGSHSGEQ